MSKKRLPMIINYVLLFAWMSVIYYFSDQPNSNETTLEMFGAFNYWVRKAAHMGEYAILFYLFHRCFPSLNWNRQKARDTANDGTLKEILTHVQTGPELAGELLIEFLLTVAYAGTDEWHQSFVPGRSALFSDVLIDAGGALIAAGLIMVGRRKPSQSKELNDKDKSSQQDL